MTALHHEDPCEKSSRAVDDLLAGIRDEFSDRIPTLGDVRSYLESHDFEPDDPKNPLAGEHKIGYANGKISVDLGTTRFVHPDEDIGNVVSMRVKAQDYLGYFRINGGKEVEEKREAESVA